jgi:hypothetical protein
MRRLICICAFLGLAMVDSVWGQGFGAAMEKIFGKQHPHYQWLDYPVNDFGIGSAYDNSRPKADPKNFLCATFTCLEIIPRPVDKEGCYTSSQAPDPGNCPWETVARTQTEYYANVACGTDAEVQLTVNKEFALKALLPIFLHAIGFSGDLDAKATNSANVTLAKACDRRLLPGPYNRFVSRLKEDTYGLRSAQSRQRLVIIRDDIIITAFEVTIKGTSKLAADLNATLKNVPPAEQMPKVPDVSLQPKSQQTSQGKATSGESASGPTASVQYSRDSSGDYHLKSTAPLIVGFAAVKQPSSAGIGPGTLETWDGWNVTKVTPPIPH